jgi:hypothetical protein
LKNGSSFIIFTPKQNNIKALLSQKSKDGFRSLLTKNVGSVREGTLRELLTRVDEIEA